MKIHFNIVITVLNVVWKKFDLLLKKFAHQNFLSFETKLKFLLLANKVVQNEMPSIFSP